MKHKEKKRQLVSQNIITIPFISLFYYINKKVSYTFATALLTSIGGFLIAGYTAVFIASTVNFTETQSGDAFIKLFLILVLCEYAPLYFIHFGALNKLGFAGFAPSLRTINLHVRNGKVGKIEHNDVLINLHKSLERLPITNMIAAGIYPSVVMIGVTIQELIIGSYKNAFFIFLGITTAIGIYIFYTYVVAELLSGELRRKIKRMMVIRKLSFSETSYSSIKRKFTFISILVMLAMIEVGLMFINQETDGLNYLPWLFILFTAVIVGSLLFFYLVSIEDALKEIESAALDLGRGGKGKLYGRSLDKEFIRMSKGIISAAYEVNEIRNNLEQKVDERTNLLQKSLTEIKKLKEQQDGDYFLISLLTDALNNINQANNQSVVVDFFVEEKKKFEFRQWKKEIGGDMCMAYSIGLRGREYTMFLNADAMGKSVQGAGGVLVMGSAIKFLIERTQDATSLKSRQYPEIWIKTAYLELQRIFESFNGSMLMSMVLGLIDEHTGLVYFINAEHPWMILYRNGKARFIESELTLHKIGIEGLNQKILVKTFQLEPNDVFIAGSDGRDDLLLGTDTKTGNRIINEDETVILKHIEESNGNLQLLIEKILDFGELTDDLSLMHIEYNPENESEKQIYTKNTSSEVDRGISFYKAKDFEKAEEILEAEARKGIYNKAQLDILIKIKIKTKKYGRAYYFAERAHHLWPLKNRYLYICSLCAKKIKNWKKAIIHGERLFLRNPRDIKNLVNLADAYRLSGQKKKAELLLSEIESIDVKNPFAEKLHDLLKIE